MALVIEDGSGVADAESYATVEEISVYWQKRAHDERASTWSGAASDAVREGAAREATAWIDGEFGRRFVGTRKSFAQGLEWPRTAGTDEDGNPIALTDGAGLALPDLPLQLKAAVCALAVAALSGDLSEAAETLGARKIAVGDVSVEFSSKASSFAALRRSAFVTLASLLAGAESWNWR